MEQNKDNPVLVLCTFNNYSCLTRVSMFNVNPFSIFSDLEDMTVNSFEPKIPDKGLKVVPENQKFEIQCLKPDGLPIPAVR